MNIQTLHNKAMDYAEDALLSKRRGNDEIAQSFYEKAFPLEKEAAFSIKATNENDRLYKSILLRSAASLALNAGCIWEAQHIFDLALKENLDSYLKQDYKELASDLKKHLKSSSSIPSITITGKIIAIDTYVNEIKIQPNTDGLSIKVLVPKDTIDDIIPIYWAHNVIIEGKAQNGIIFLETIRKAA